MRVSDLLNIVYRNIMRTRPFFVANVIAVSTGIVLIVVMLSLAMGVSHFTDNIMRDEATALAIEISNEEKSDASTKLSEKGLKKLKDVEGVSRVVPVIQGLFADLATEGNDRTTIIVCSTVGNDDPELKRLILENGTLESLENIHDHYLILPKQVVKELGIYPASQAFSKKLKLTFKKSNGEKEKVITFKVLVAGIARKTRHYRCYAPLALLKKVWVWQNRQTSNSTLHNRQPGIKNAQLQNFVYESAIVYGEKLNEIEKIRHSLEKIGYKTFSILDTVKWYKNIALIVSIVLGLIGFISLSAGSLSIFNATYASVLRRKKEIGIYKTYGAKKEIILRIILTEIAATAMLSGILGFIAGWMVCRGVEKYFLSEAKIMLFKTSFGLFILIEILALLVCFLAGLIPALKAARLRPVEAIRHDT